MLIALFSVPDEFWGPMQKIKSNLRAHNHGSKVYKYYAKNLIDKHDLAYEGIIELSNVNSAFDDHVDDDLPYYGSKSSFYSEKYLEGTLCCTGRILIYEKIEGSHTPETLGHLDFSYH